MFIFESANRGSRTTSQVTEAINEEGFQVLMRMGYGKEDVMPTPRRSADEVLH